MREAEGVMGKREGRGNVRAKGGGHWRALLFEECIEHKKGEGEGDWGVNAGESFARRAVGGLSHETRPFKN